MERTVGQPVTEADLVDKLCYYHHHDQQRQTVAENGWRRAHTCYSAQRVTRFMVETIASTPYTDTYEWQDEIYPRT